MDDRELSERIEALSDDDVRAAVEFYSNKWWRWGMSDLFRRLAREVQTLRAELDKQKAANLALAERLAACSQVLSRAAERNGFDIEAVIAAQSYKGGIAAVIGKWPGDETDAEIAAALDAERGKVCGCQPQTEANQ